MNLCYYEIFKPYSKKQKKTNKKKQKMKFNWPWDLAGWIGIACSFHVTNFQPKRSLTRFFSEYCTF